MLCVVIVDEITKRVYQNIAKTSVKSNEPECQRRTRRERTQDVALGIYSRIQESESLNSEVEQSLYLALRLRLYTTPNLKSAVSMR